MDQIICIDMVMVACIIFNVPTTVKEFSGVAIFHLWFHFIDNHGDYFRYL